MTLFRWLVLAASVIFAASSFAQDKDKADEAAKAPEKQADKPAEAKPQPVIEISRSTQVNCDIKPVMTDEEIARCRNKAWSGGSGGPR
jgi:hypothetical protein